MYYLIGDIHGHAKELQRLLVSLGFRKQNGLYTHPTHKAVFVGDFIDRGDEIKEVLEIVKPMLEKESAYAVLGNHEYNAICYSTINENTNDYFREHSEKNNKQHAKTLKQLGSDLNYYLDWFRALPLYLEFNEFRVVHASWNDSHIDYLKGSLKSNSVNGLDLVEANNKDSKLYQVIEDTLKGSEITLPVGMEFFDKDGHSRTAIRSKWFEKPRENITYQELCLPKQISVPEIVVPNSLLADFKYYDSNIPIFFGHYWLEEKSPSILTESAVCLDYSVAKEGFIGCYEFNGEKLSNHNFRSY